MLDLKKGEVDLLLMSICIPVYNSEKTIESAVNSILACGRNDIEVVLFYDKSTDATLNIIKGMTDTRIRIVCNAQKMDYGKMLLECGNSCLGKYLMYVIDRNYISGQMLDEFLDMIEENEDIVCGMCSPVRHHTYKIYCDTVDKINALGYQAQHITGSFFQTRLFKQLVPDLKNVDYGNFPLDFLFSLFCLEGKGVLYNEIYQSDSDYMSVVQCKTKSSTNKATEWFRPLGQMKYLRTAVKHLCQLEISGVEKKKIFKHLYRRIKVQATWGYKNILVDSRFCGHYNIESKYVGVHQLAFWSVLIFFHKVYCSVLIAAVRVRF